MSVSSALSAAGRTEVSVSNAVSIVIATAPFGYLFGSLFTVHVVPAETVGVWLTTIAFAVLGLLLWSARS